MKKSRSKHKSFTFAIKELLDKRKWAKLPYSEKKVIWEISSLQELGRRNNITLDYTE